ncbi:hypothetical protein ACP70R_012209 [Stipagrostis hirtigluma subsp. patula]
MPPEAEVLLHHLLNKPSRWGLRRAQEPLPARLQPGGELGRLRGGQSAAAAEAHVQDRPVRLLVQPPEAAVLGGGFTAGASGYQNQPLGASGQMREKGSQRAPVGS